MVTYNILADHIGNGWGVRRTAVAQFLANPDFDIIALQEVTEAQMADLALALPHHAYIVGERSDGHRGDQGWYEFNPILFARDRYELIDHSSFWVSETPGIAGSILPGTKAHARVLTWVRLRERATGRTFMVASVHIHGQLSSQGREADEVQIILSGLAQANAGEPLLLLGDFNFLEASPGYKALVGGPSALADLAPDTERQVSTVIGPDGITLDGGSPKPRERMAGDPKRIDYIFACGATLAYDFDVPQITIKETKYFASDHHPVTASLSLDQAGCTRIGAGNDRQDAN